MNKRFRLHLCAGFAAAALATTWGCSAQPSPVSPSAALPAATAATEASGGLDPQIAQQLAQLRQVTARFHSFDEAVSAGWGTQLTGCLTLAGVGGQGFHYGNTSLIDGQVSLLQPELLMYEPRGGKLHLVGVEYIIPFEAWTASEPPELLGQQFHRNEGAGLWVLHAWIWQGNPDGMFADWNPTVRCD